MRVVQSDHLKDIRSLMGELGVDPYGIGIMAPKALTFSVRINALSPILANILKQEMLSLGGDVALARDVLTGKVPVSDCLLIGSLSQFHRLEEKLKKQPFGLSDLARGLSQTLANYQKEHFSVELGPYRLRLGARARIMGIINLTPDSFSGDGLIKKPSLTRGSKNGPAPAAEAVEAVKRQVRDGADIIDMGGESSRPGARAVTVKEELKRVIPSIRAVARACKVPISVDTYKPEVAEQALDNGAVLVNDITGLRNKKMAKIIARKKAGVVIMHMQGTPRTMQKQPRYESLTDDILDFFRGALSTAEDAGISEGKIILDPGIGFGKTLAHNLRILKDLAGFKILGKPLLAGVSRKSFIGTLLKKDDPRGRANGTIASALIARAHGAHILRVHDVRPIKEAMQIFDAVKTS